MDTNEDIQQKPADKAAKKKSGIMSFFGGNKNRGASASAARTDNIQPVVSAQKPIQAYRKPQ